jgi:hypothetical protein
VKTAYEYIYFEKSPRARGAKTDTWAVRNKRSGDLLGSIAWYGAWRQYCFYATVAGCVFNKGCLADIQEFLEAAMEERRKERESVR